MARIELPAGDGPEVARALALRPDFMPAVAAYETACWHATLDWRLHELVRYRIALINECTVCMDWRTPQAVQAGVTEELLSGVVTATGDAAYTPREQVAVEYAGRFATDSARIGDDLMARLAEQFDPGEIVELTLLIGKYLAMGRFMQVLGLDQGTCAITPDALKTMYATSESSPEGRP